MCLSIKSGMRLSLCAQPFSAQHIDFCHNLPSINRHYAYIEQGRMCVLRVSGQPVCVGLNLIYSHVVDKFSVKVMHYP